MNIFKILMLLSFISFGYRCFINSFLLAGLSFLMMVGLFVLDCSFGQKFCVKNNKDK
jgi:hypothetical protein